MRQQKQHEDDFGMSKPVNRNPKVRQVPAEQHCGLLELSVSDKWHDFVALGAHP